MKWLVKKNRMVFDILLLFVAVISTLFCIFYGDEMGYNNMFLLPLVYLICYFGGLEKLLGVNSTFFCNVFVGISFLRYVILPPFTVYSKYHLIETKYSPTAKDKNFAVLLMCYEILILTIVLIHLYGRGKVYSIKKIMSSTKKYKYEKWSVFFIVLFVIVIFVSVLNDNIMSQFNFIIPSQISTIRYNNVYSYFENTSGIIKILVILLNVFISLIFVNMMLYFGEKYMRNNNLIYYIMTCICGILNITIYQGSNRSAMLIKGLTTLIVLLILFPNKRKQLVFFFLMLIVVIVVLLSLSRNHHMLKSIEVISNTLNGYLAGPENVSISINIKNLSEAQANSKIVNFLYDLVRPVVGLGSLIKSENILTTPEMYNYLIYGSKQGASILPFIGQGYYYFGFLLAPLLEVFFVLLVHYIETIVSKIKNLLILYFLEFVSIRMGFFMAQNLYIQINSLISLLVISVTVIWLNHLIVLGINKNKK